MSFFTDENNAVQWNSEAQEGYLESCIAPYSREVDGTTIKVEPGTTPYESDMEATTIKVEPDLKMSYFEHSGNNSDVKLDEETEERCLEDCISREVEGTTIKVEPDITVPLAVGADGVRSINEDSGISGCKYMDIDSLYPCRNCDKKFQQVEELRLHTHLHRGNQYTCQICGKSFKLETCLSNHLLIHNPKFQCNICGRACTSSIGLKRHMGIHAEEKPFQCDVCSKTFHLRKLFRQHMVCHTDDRRYVCHICNKSFPRSGSLNSHVLIHSQSKNYQCNVCDRGFTLKGNLQKHLRHHLTESPAWKCEICDVEFSKKGLLSRHTFSQHEPVDCQKCNENFPNRIELRKHATNVHSKRVIHPPAPPLKYFPGQL